MSITTPNLVQIENRLKSLPPTPQTFQFLKAAKDGQVVEVPPYLAAAQLARLEKEQQRQQLSQGAQMNAPSISQQLSQKADLMALMAMKERAAGQEQAQAARSMPGPAPEGIGAPPRQPRPEDAGLASLPVDFKLAGGGIVAFSPGGLSLGYAPDAQELEKLGIQLSIYDDAETRADKLRYAAAVREAQAAGQPVPPAPASFGRPRQPSTPEDIKSANVEVDEQGLPRSNQAQAEILRKRAELERQERMKGLQVAPEAMERMNAFYKPRRPETKPGEEAVTVEPPRPPVAGAKPAAAPGTKPPAAAPGTKPPAASLAAAAPQGGVNLANISPFPLGEEAGSLEGAARKRITDAITATQKPATTADAIKDINAIYEAMGVGKPGGEEERRLIQQMQATHEAEQKRRGLRGLQSVLGGFSRGFGGAADADIAEQQRVYAQDMAHQKAMYELISGLNSSDRKERVSKAEKVAGLFEANVKNVADADRATLKAAVDASNILSDEKKSKYSVDMHYLTAMEAAKRAERSADRTYDKIALDALQGTERSLTTELNTLRRDIPTQANKEAIAHREKMLAEVRSSLSVLIRKTGGVPPVTVPAPSASKKPPISSFQK